MPAAATEKPGWDGYAPPARRPPLAPYLALSSGFVAAVASFLLMRRRQGGLPERIDAGDLALVGAASFKLSRLVTKKKIAAPIRAPFTEYQGKGAAPAEVIEKPRGGGVQATVGELLTCPYCLGLWMATAMVGGLVTAPRETRAVASILTTLGVSDFLHAAYRAIAAKDR
jgi:hypothetical protein